jgi:hypothetical protein
LLSTVDADALAMTTSLATIILIPTLMTENDLLKKPSASQYISDSVVGSI